MEMYGIARGELHRILDISRLKYKKKNFVAE